MGENNSSTKDSIVSSQSGTGKIFLRRIRKKGKTGGQKINMKIVMQLVRNFQSGNFEKLSVLSRAAFYKRYTCVTAVVGQLSDYSCTHTLA